MPFKQKLTACAASLIALSLCIWMEGFAMFTSFTAHAQAAGAAGNMFDGIAGTAAMLATGLQMIGFIAFHFLQFLLDPLFITDITVMTALQTIWQYSRDIMNVIFAFMLIFAALYTVVNWEQGKSFITEKYKKFILAVILVNFSWFFPRLILDVANVLTATIYQLPSGLNGGRIECRLPADPNQPGPGEPCTIVTDVKYFNSCNPLPEDYINIITGVICYKAEPFNENTNTAYGMLNGLVINYARLPQLTRVLAPPDNNPAAGDIEWQEAFVFVMYIFFVFALIIMIALPLIAMFVVFLIRIPILWFTMAFMPFMFLGFVAEDKLTPGLNTYDIFKHFVKAAFLPAAIAVPFSIGFLLLTAITQVDCNDMLGNMPGAANALCEANGPMVHGVHSLWSFMLLMISFIIIWMGFWTAIKIDDIYTKVTGGIQSFGQMIGSTMLKLPLSVPFIPMGGRNVSLLGLDNVGQRFKHHIEAGHGPLSFGGHGEAGHDAGGTPRGLTAALEGNDQTNQLLRDIREELSNNRPAPGTDFTAHIGTRRAAFDEILTRHNVSTDMSDAELANGLQVSNQFQNEIPQNP